MLHYDVQIRQHNKDGHDLCGDHIAAFSFKDSYYYAIFDGIGSGVYANLAAIGSSGRWARMIREGISISEACETMASDMNRAKNTRSPFTAFTALMLTRHGNVLLYTYESPKAILRRGKVTQVLEPHQYNVGGDIFGETKFDLDEGDVLFLFSDGISQAGLGCTYPLGWNEEGVASYIQVCSKDNPDDQILDCLVERCRNLSGGYHGDDSTIIMIKTVKARHLSLFSGPPSSRGLDEEFAQSFRNAKGVRIICGSSTSGILARELSVRLSLISEGDGFSSPPRYAMKGADLVTEGALELNQVAKLLEADVDEITGDTPAEQLAQLLLDTDVIDIYEGTARNEAHRMTFFRQLGIKPRRDALRSIMNSLELMGKMIHYHTF